MIRWLAEVKHKNRKPEIIPNGELDKYCAMFILSIKKAGGGEYKPDSLISKFNSIAPYIRTNNKINMNSDASEAFHRSGDCCLQNVKN
jgi:hypothetical protein